MGFLGLLSLCVGGHSGLEHHPDQQVMLVRDVDGTGTAVCDMTKTC